MKASDSLANMWTNNLDEQEASGQSGASWCRQKNIRYSTFLYWRRRLKNKSQVQECKPSFIELVNNEEKLCSNWMEITIQGAKIILSRKFDKDGLLHCLKILGEMGC